MTATATLLWGPMIASMVPKIADTSQRRSMAKVHRGLIFSWEPPFATFFETGLEFKADLIKLNL